MAFGIMAANRNRVIPYGEGDLARRLEQVTGDLFSAIESQREAGERAALLQGELQRITDYAGSIEEGAGRIEAGSRNLAEQLSGIIDKSGDLRDGIDRAYDSLEESRVLLNELRTIIQGLP